MKHALGCLWLLSAALTILGPIPKLRAEPVKIAVIGLTHTHVHWILGRPDRGDIQIVGIVESNRELAERYARQHGCDLELLYPSLEKLVDTVQFEAVAAFGSTFEHLEVVQFFSRRGIHVMVEKPLAVNIEHASQMARLAREHQIHLLTNYETSWYPTLHEAHKIACVNNQLGPLRKVVVHAGHRGPQEIGVNREFLEWLTDRQQNGGGAVTDFGCYGVNLMNWFTHNERPTSVTCVLRRFKPDVYPHVDDDATIVLDYAQKQAIVQASWNWPISRKDMEIYGTTGQLVCHDAARMELHLGDDTARELQPADRTPPYDDPFAFLAAVVREEIRPGPHDPSALENNLLMVEILDAAKRSAAEGRRVPLVPAR